jgi:hypothetical protein
MHNSFFSTNDHLLDQAVNSYWRRRDGVIARRKAAKEEEAKVEDNSFELTDKEAQRFNVKVRQGEGDECDVWIGGKFSQGYGRFSLRGRNRRAHIISWQHANGRLANPSRSMVIAHLCETESCVKPSHLDEQTQQQNALYADSSIPAMHRAKTHCPKGHELIEGNCKPTQWAQGHRVCQVCHLAKIRKLNALTKAAREALGITQVEYALLYGWGQAAAIAIANDPGCELEHRKK